MVVPVVLMTRGSSAFQFPVVWCWPIGGSLVAGRYHLC